MIWETLLAPVSEIIKKVWTRVAGDKLSRGGQGTPWRCEAQKLTLPRSGQRGNVPQFHHRSMREPRRICRGSIQIFEGSVGGRCSPLSAVGVGCGDSIGSLWGLSAQSSSRLCERS